MRHCSLRVLITAAMAWIATKYLVTAALVVVISEVAKRSDRIGSLIAALPLVTVLTLLWLYFEKQPAERITNHAWYTFWYVLPTLPMFALMCAAVALIYIFPGIVTWLPTQMAAR